MEADSLRLQIAAHPNPELRAKLEHVGVPVSHDHAQMKRLLFFGPCASVNALDGTMVQMDDGRVAMLKIP